MKNPILAGICCLLFLNYSCSKNKDLDDEGRLNVLALSSSSGGMDFAPMQHSDSNYVKEFKPLVYNYEGKPYSGKVAAYSNEKLSVTGELTDGKQSGVWTFYYPRGVVQIEGTYTDGMETGMWNSYYSKDHLKISKYYDTKGYMLMRKEYYDNGKIKNYQNIKCPEFGDRERRIQFKYNGDIDYLDAEREVGKLSPQELNIMLQHDQLLKR